MQKKYSAIDHLDGLELVRTRDIPQDVRGINTFQGIGQRGSLDLTVFADHKPRSAPRLKLNRQHGFPHSYRE